MHRQHVGTLEQRGPGRDDLHAVGGGVRPRALAAPGDDPHPEGLAEARDCRTEPAVPEDAERGAPKAVPDLCLPAALAKRGGLLGDVADRGQDEPPGELGRRVGGHPRMQVGGDDDAEPGARGDVDVRVDASLADEPQGGQSLEERRSDSGPLPDEDQRLGRREPACELVDVVGVIREDADVVSSECGEALQGAHRVAVVIEDRDEHLLRLSSSVPTSR